MNTIIRNVSQLQEPERLQIIDFLITQFPDNPSYQRVVYTNPELELCITMEDDTTIIGHAGITKRIVTAHGRSYIVGGIGDVAIDPSYRKQGLGTTLMKTVYSTLKEHNYDLGVLFCHPNLDHFYSTCGWMKKEHGSIFATVNGIKEDQQRTFFLPLNLNSDDIAYWNSADIDVGVGTW